MIELDALIAAAQQILRADATTMQVGVRELEMFGMGVCLIGMLTLAYIAVIRGTRSFGFRDGHADAVGRQLRAHFQTPAAGDVFVYPDWCEASAESALARP